MKAIPEYENLYSCSKDGLIYSHRAERFLKPSCNNSGYLGVTLFGLEGEQKSYLVHRLVALTFIENPDLKPCINHIDRNKLNNSVSNLEWCTYGENNNHSRISLPKNHFKRLDIDLAHKVIQYTMDGWRQKDIHDSLGIPRSTIKHILFDNSYKEIREEYDWENRPNKSASIDEDTVIKICQLLESGESYKTISDKTGVSSKKIGNIKNKITYRKISDSFHF